MTNRSRTRLRVEPLEERTTPAIFTVTTFADISDGGDNVLSLREAVAATFGTTDADTIVLGTGTYSLSDNDAGDLALFDADVYGGVTINGVGQGSTTIAGTADFAFRLFTVEGGDLTLNDVTLTGGKGVGDGEVGGGAVLVLGFSCGCEGGGTTSLALNRSTVAGNSSVNGGGIAGFGFGGVNITLTDSTVSNNVVSGAEGVAAGGGISIFAANLSLLRSTVSGNTVTALDHSTPSEGTVFGDDALGGGIFFLGAEGAASLSIVNSTISGNVIRAGNASASGTDDAVGGSAYGGGLYVDADGLAVTIRNSTIAFNQAIAGSASTSGSGTTEDGHASGGGIDNDSCGCSDSVSIGSTIVAGNTTTDPDGSSVASQVFGEFTSAGNNLVSIVDAEAEGFTNGVNGDIVGTVNAPIDAGLAALADNGGFTRTHALSAVSIAINTGSNPLGLATDQRGQVRTFGGATDIGSFEFVPPSPPPPPPPPDVEVVPPLSFGLGIDGFGRAGVIVGGVPSQIVEPFAGFNGPVVALSGDFNNDGVLDRAFAVAGLGASHVKAFSGVDGALLHSFFAFDMAYLGGVTLAAGDVDGDGFDDLVVGSAVGATHVKVFSGRTGAEIASFFAFPGAPAGVSVAAADFDGDGKADVVAGAGLGVSGHVQVFLSGTGAVTGFFPFGEAYLGGVNVAAGDVNGDGVPEVIAGAATGSSRVRVQRLDESELFSLFAFPGLPLGIRVGFADADGDGDGDAVAAVGPGAAPHVRAYDGEGNEVLSVFVAPIAFLGGVFVG